MVYGLYPGKYNANVVFYIWNIYIYEKKLDVKYLKVQRLTVCARHVEKTRSNDRQKNQLFGRNNRTQVIKN